MEEKLDYISSSPLLDTAPVTKAVVTNSEKNKLARISSLLNERIAHLNSISSLNKEGDVAQQILVNEKAAFYLQEVISVIQDILEEDE
jgi:hypothetical protein